MSLAKTQQAASAVSLSPVLNGLLLAPLHLNVNYRAHKKKEGVCLSQWAKSILLKQMVARAWDFNHRNKAGAFLSSEVPIMLAPELREMEKVE